MTLTAPLELASSLILSSIGGIDSSSSALISLILFLRERVVFFGD